MNTMNIKHADGFSNLSIQQWNKYTNIYMMIFVWLIYLFITSGCSNVKYWQYLPCKSLSKNWESVKFIEGDLGKFKEYLDKSQLPHLTPKDKFILDLQAKDQLTQQLGSRNYMIIGEVAGAGNAYTSMDDVKKEMAKKVVKEGGEVVLIFRSGLDAQSWSYTTPGYATSSTSGTAYATTHGNTTYVTGRAHGSTTYTPPQTHSGVNYKPYCQGMVFKYNPTREERIKKILLLDDKLFQQYMNYAQTLSNMDCECMWNEFDKYLQSHTK